MDSTLLWLKNVGKRSFGVVALLVIWEVVTRGFGVPGYILPAPSVIVVSLVDKWAILWPAALVTLLETISGFLLSAFIGITLAVVITSSVFLRNNLMPLIVALQLIPVIAIAPVILIWAGYGLASKIVIAFIISLFPVVINTSVGLLSIERELVDLFRSLRAPRLALFFKAQVPNSLPYIFTGLRVSITLAMIGAVVGEFVGGSKGLGYLIVVGTSNLETDFVFAGIALLAVGGYLLFGLLETIERYVIPWSTDERSDTMTLITK